MNADLLFAVFVSTALGILIGKYPKVRDQIFWVAIAIAFVLIFI